MAESVILPSFATSRLGVQMLTLLGELSEALTQEVGLTHLMPGGEVVWDDCCDGQLWVRVIEKYPASRRFPQPDNPDNLCRTTMFAVRIGVGVLRCAHSLDNDGNAPTALEMTGDADLTYRDSQETFGVLNSQQTFTRVIRWIPLGPAGGCVGGEWECLVGEQLCD